MSVGSLKKVLVVGFRADLLICIFLSFFLLLSAFVPLPPAAAPPPPPPSFACTRAAWKVNFVGESGVDQGGLFRDSLTTLVTDLEEPHVQMLIPCWNNRKARGKVGRDKFVPNPAYTTARHLELWCFVGKAMGIAIRIGNPIPLNLPSLVWKQLVGQPVGREDLRMIDDNIVEIHDTLLAYRDHVASDRRVFDERSTFVYQVRDSNDGLHDLVPDGGEKRVAFEDRARYVGMVEAWRLHESAPAARAMRAGLSTIVPLGYLGLYSWRDLQHMVCGRPGFDVDVLKAHCNRSADDKICDWLFQALESFTPEERELFLIFVWGRSRLPNGKTGWTHKMKISSRSGGDTSFPHR